MGSLTAGVLLKLLQSMHEQHEIKLRGEHRKVLLQVISIVPADGGEFWRAERGFYLKVSDSAHAVFVALAEEDVNLVLANEIGLGQLIEVERLRPGSPHPIVCGVRPVPRRHRGFSIGNPEEISAAAFHCGAEFQREDSAKNGCVKFEAAFSPRPVKAGEARDGLRRCWSELRETKEKRCSGAVARDGNGVDSVHKANNGSSQVTAKSPQKISYSKTGSQSLKSKPTTPSLNPSYNVVKVPLKSEELTTAKTSWEALPPSFVESAKKALQLRDAALWTAVEALQQASVAENILRNFSMFADLSTSAKADDPHPSVEKFLSIHAGLRQASLAAGALASTKNVERASNDDDSNMCPTQEAFASLAERRKTATSWIRAALASDLSSFTLFTRQTPSTAQKQKGKDTTGKNKLLIVLANSSKSDAGKTTNIEESRSPPSKVKSPSLQSSIHQPEKSPHLSKQVKHNVLKECENKVAKPTSPSTQTGLACQKGFLKISTKNSIFKATTKRHCEDSSSDISTAECIKEKGLQDTAELAQKLLCTSQFWFIKFMEGALASCVRKLKKDKSKGQEAEKSEAQPGKDQIAGMLSQLKRVNEWLDEIGFSKKRTDKSQNVDPQLIKAMASLKKNMYDFLLQNVESAALAMGTQTY